MKDLILFNENDLRSVVMDVVTESLVAIQIKSSEQDEYLTRKGAADLLKVSVTTIDTWRHKGIIKAYHFNSRVRFRRSELMQAIY